MSLMERVRRAGNDEQHAALERYQVVELLRRAVYDYLPAQDIAQTAAGNPQLARNEIRSVCERLFREESGLAVWEEERDKLIDELVDSVFGLGPLEGMLSDEQVTEIMVNGTQSIFYEQGGVLYRAPVCFTSDSQVRSLIDRIIGPIGRRIDESSPTVDARLAQGYRVHAVIPPIAIDGPAVTIRKFTAHTMRLSEMVARNSMTEAVATVLAWTVRARRSIAVTGGTGTGKTTLLNALSCEIPIAERIVTIEDSAELRFVEHPHVVRLEARPRNAEGVGEVTIRDLVINALRMRPDRIVVGECRGGEALDMLSAMNTGHDGSMTTLHANSPTDALKRLSMMVRFAVDLPVDVIEGHIESALDLIVHVARDPNGQRYVAQLAELSSGEGSACLLRVLYERKQAAEQGVWRAAPSWIETLEERAVASRQEVLQWRKTSLL